MRKKDQMNTKYSFNHTKSRKHTRETAEPNGAHGIIGALRGQDRSWEAKWILCINFHCGLNCRCVLDPFGKGGYSSECMSEIPVAINFVEMLPIQKLTDYQWWTVFAQKLLEKSRMKYLNCSWQHVPLSLKLFWYMRIWQMANVIPVFKMDSTGNYRPVAWHLHPPN